MLILAYVELVGEGETIVNGLDSNIFTALEDAADGAFVVDASLRIHAWNNAAEEILGFSKEDVEGNFCYQVLQGSNDEGHQFCRENCQVSKSVRDSKPVTNYDLQVRTDQGEKCWLNMSILVLRKENEQNEWMIVHLFRDISGKKTDELILSKILETAQRYQNNTSEINREIDSEHRGEKLTRRQQEVLGLLARGFSTREIAESLSISQYTARNHIQYIFQKFHVHSRLEAVTYALKHGLLEQKNDTDIP